MASIWSYVSVISVAFLVGCVLLFSYRLLFHPLAGIPGPLSMKLTGWAHLKVVTSGRRHHILHELHQSYGNVPVGLRRVTF